MNNRLFTRKRVTVLICVGVIALVFASFGAQYISYANAAENSLNVSTVAATQSATNSESVRLASAPVAIVYGADPTILTGTFINDTDEPIGVAISARDLDFSSFSDGELRATRVLSTVEAGLESNTVETSLDDFASEGTVAEQFGASSMEVDPGQVVTYSVKITPPAEGDPMLDRKPFITNINLAATFKDRTSEEAGS